MVGKLWTLDITEFLTLWVQCLTTWENVRDDFFRFEQKMI